MTGKYARVSARSETLSFGSGTENTNGLQLKLSFDEDTKTVYGQFKADDRFVGEPGEIHPGILATILDETMIKINQAMNLDTLTCELTIRYLMPARPGEGLYLRGWFVKKSRRIVENRAEIENEIGKVVARGKGKYVEREEE